MMASGGRKLKILFGVSEGENYARQLAAIAAAMSDAKCRFIGFSWSTGRDLREKGLDYTHIPWKYGGVQIPYDVPAVGEFTARGYRQDTTPYSAREALGALTAFIEREIELFSPDIVVYGPIDHAICYLMDENAKTRGIPRIGIQPCFVMDHVIAQSHGGNWEHHLRDAIIPESYNDKSLEVGVPIPGVSLRLISNKKTIWKLSLWIRGIECALRVLSGGVSFDTWQSLASLFISKVAPKKWFSNFKTLESVEDVNHGCVLVALHQPSLPGNFPTWVDLIAFAVKATPEGVPIVIRPHPVEVARQIPKDLENALRSRAVLISRADHGPSLPGLLKQCRAMITISSAIGMDALLAGVPVFALGPAFYTRPGMARAVTVSDTSMVRELLSKTEQCRPDIEEVRKFVKWLFDEWMCPSPLIDTAGKKKLVKRIRSAVP